MMKKKFFALFLALCMMFTLAACAGSAADFEGKWLSCVDLGSEIREGLTQETINAAFGMEDTSKYLSVDSLVIPELPISLVLNADGSYVLALEEESKQLVTDAVIGWFTGCDMEGLFTEMISVLANEAGISVEDLQSFYGADSIATLMEAIFGAPMDEFMASLGGEIAAAMGKELDLETYVETSAWEYQDGQLLLTDAEGTVAFVPSEDASQITLPASAGVFAGDTVFTKE